MTIRFLEKWVSKDGIPCGWEMNMIHNLELSLQKFDEDVLDYWNEVSTNGGKDSLKNISVFLKNNNITRNLSEMWEELNRPTDDELYESLVRVRIENESEESTNV
jgi:hypothetical protein